MHAENLFTLTASAAGIATPRIMAAGDDPPDFAMRMLWYGMVGALTFLAAWANWSKISARRRATVGANGKDEEETSAACQHPSQHGVSHEQHSRELADVYAKIDSVFKLLDGKISAQANSLSTVAQSVAASRAETKTLTAAVQSMLKLLTAEKTKPQ